MITDTYDALLQSICDDPTNEGAWYGVMIMADYLEEQGNPIAAGWRKIAAENKMPEDVTESNCWEFPFSWYSMNYAIIKNFYKEELLKDDLMRRLHGEGVSNEKMREYKTKQAALEDLARVYAQVPCDCGDGIQHPTPPVENYNDIDSIVCRKCQGERWVDPCSSIHQ